MNDGIVYAWMIFIVEKVRKKLFFKEFFWCREKCINKEVLRTVDTLLSVKT